jgi:hypothetical protein
MTRIPRAFACGVVQAAALMTLAACGAEGARVVTGASPSPSESARLTSQGEPWFTTGAPKFMQAREFPVLDCPTNAQGGPGTFEFGDLDELQPENRSAREIAKEFFDKSDLPVVDRYGTGQLIESKPFSVPGGTGEYETRMNIGVPNETGGILAYVELTKHPTVGWIFTTYASCSMVTIKD